MPLTFPSHAAAVLPFARPGGRLVPAALVMGSCAPDLAYLFGFWTFAKPFHGPAGVALCAPLAIAVWVWLERWILPALTAARLSAFGIDLAQALRTRGLPTSPRAWAWALLSLAFGTATHVIWDGFTHATGWPARILYGHVAFRTGATRITLASMLQMLSHGVGLALVYRAVLERFPAPRDATSAWGHPVFTITLAGWLGGVAIALALAAAHGSLDGLAPWMTFWIAARTGLLALTAACLPPLTSWRRARARR